MLKSSLTNRKQNGTINGIESIKFLAIRVPQGSVLGPFFFLV